MFHLFDYLHVVGYPAKWRTLHKGSFTQTTVEGGRAQTSIRRSLAQFGVPYCGVENSQTEPLRVSLTAAF
jgi:hypothetical protein